jgi:hypothetical protein
MTTQYDPNSEPPNDPDFDAFMEACFQECVAEGSHLLNHYDGDAESGPCEPQTWCVRCHDHERPIT